MEGFAYWPAFSIGISVVSAGVLLLMQIRQGKDKLSADTLKKYEDALDVREITIRDLNEKLAKKDDQHASEIRGLQAQITGLQAQVTALTEQKKTLEDAVTGKVYLEKILAKLDNLEPLLGEDGIMQSTKKDLDDIKSFLDISKRQKDHGTTP